MGWGWSAALRCNPARRRDRGSKGKGGRDGGGSPGLHKRISDFAKLLKGASARKVGDTVPAGVSLLTLYPCAREGGALSKFSSKRVGPQVPHIDRVETMMSMRNAPLGERGVLALFDQSPLRRDQMRLKFWSSASTSDA